MSNWKQFSAYVEKNYKIADVGADGGILRLLFGLSGGRSQLVSLAKAGSKLSGDWVEIESPVGKLNDAQIRQALAMANEKICGGLVTWNDGMVILKHSLPLRSFEPKDFAWILEAVVETADSIEEKLLGSDAF
jgi:hypothetical protein